MLLTTATRTDERVEVELPKPSEKIEKRRVGCVKCSHTLLEFFMESPEGSKVWLKVKCKACGEYNLIVHVNGKTQVGQV